MGGLGKQVWMLLVTVAWVLLAMGCRSAEPDEGRVRLVVFAASSLTEVLRSMEADFEKAHPDIDVQLNFAGSQVLRFQIAQGARADVYISANAQHVDALERDALVTHRYEIANNTLVVITPPRSAIEVFADLDQAQRIVIGAENVPVGQYTRQLLRQARAVMGEDFVAAIETHVVSEEANVRLVRTKIELGEADAAWVYRTDVLDTSKVRVIEVPDALRMRVTYVLATLTHSKHAGAAQQFADHVRAATSRKIWMQHGFAVEDE